MAGKVQIKTIGALRACSATQRSDAQSRQAAGRARGRIAFCDLRWVRDGPGHLGLVESRAWLMFADVGYCLIFEAVSGGPRVLE